MKADPAVTRLSAGLGRVEQLARDVVDLEKPYRDLAREGVTAEIRYEWVRHTKLSTGGAGSIFLEGAPSPQHVLRQADAIRKVLDEYRRLDEVLTRGPVVIGSAASDNYLEGRRDALEECLEALASIYTDETSEAGTDV